MAALRELQAIAGWRPASWRASLLAFVKTLQTGALKKKHGAQSNEERHKKCKQ